MSAPPLSVATRPDGLFVAAFTAMASPCELLMYCADHAQASELAELAADEAWRIEAKFSRYRSDSVVAQIHLNRGRPFELDTETASLLDFAQQCFELSGGLFDITSGILRRAWKFDGSDHVPDAATVEALLPLIGFDKVCWQRPNLLLPTDMELDFGGIGKEYAVDRAYDLLAAACREPFLVNFGGDLRANMPPQHGPWRVGIERPDEEGAAALLLELERGALATSGDSQRFVLKDSVRYGHILDPRTGWPAAGAPRSVTVAASSCTEAGLLATLAMLLGSGAQQFLEEQAARHWIIE